MKRIILFLLFIVSIIAVQAQVKVRGTVTDADNGSSLVGATIIIEGTTVGTLSNVDGKYEIEAPGNDAVIQISFIGYKSEKVKVEGKTTIDFQLESDIAGLDEVVVVGYGTQKKSHLTGAISKVSNDGLDEIPVARADEALIGKVSGVTIQMTDASAGAAPTINVRGIGAVSYASSPLVVMDGVIVGDDFLGSIDMNDVESIEILKDAASTAIYGSRGANGVIMVTTKQGKEGKTVFSFNAYRGMKFAANTDDFFPSLDEWTQYEKDNNGTGVSSDKMILANQMADAGMESDWLDIMLTGGTIQSYSLSARGGSEKTKFSVSGSYLGDEGILLTDDYKKLNLRVKIDTKVNDVISFGASINPSYTNKRDFALGFHDAIRNITMTPIYVTENSLKFLNRDNYPDIQVGDYARDDYFNHYDLYGNGSDVYVRNTSNANPYQKVYERDYQTYQFKLFSNAYLGIQLAKGLKFKSSVSAIYRSYQDVEWTGSQAHRNGASAMASDYATDLGYELSNDNILSYNRTFGKHDLSAVAGVTFEKTHMQTLDLEGSGFAFDYIRTQNAASTVALNTSSLSNTGIYESSFNSFLSRFNYAYDGKYLVSLSARYDGSSKFGIDTKYGFFPAASIGWRVTEEDFLKDNSTISNLKLRAAFGKSGTQSGIGYYDAVGLLGADYAIMDGISAAGFNPLNITNGDLAWEMSTEIGAGVDFGFFDNKITFSADIYSKLSDGLLLEQPIPSVTGFDETVVNIGQVKNSGYELEVSSLILNSKDLSWTLSGNLSQNVNELVDFAGGSGLISFVDSKRPAEYIALEGNPISSFYGYQYEKDIALEYINNPYWPVGGSAQDCYVKDLNGDGEIDTDDRTILGSPYPKLVWGLSSSLKFKSFDFSFTFQGSHGGKVRNMDQQYYENQFSSNQDYIATFPDADKVVQKVFTDLYVQDASFVSMRSINLGFTLPRSIAAKAGLNKARIYVSGQNLIFIMADGYTSFNPEGITDNDSPIRGGYQRGSAPVPHAFTVGVNLEF